ncbi:chemotaxis protein CheD [Chitinibacter bivalviorum]|uniref:Chemotaxis protein CheD n=1 Tax=Chitinibacter bivalviorum TaxID=2739434 RepID=A0A7H9BK90_9NEIS|nr:chemotaxis protein CheD [Chitinibacter bivalviorum]QLG89097.1 chemotaxis protein CheD [Chitinibacter bivalviorum]
MNHFLVPLHHSLDEQEGYFSGMTSMEVLINAMMKAGANKRHLLAKAFGGGDMLRMSTLGNIGQRNIDFAQQWLESERIPLMASDLGGYWARKVIFEPNNGDVFCRRIEAKLPQMRELARAEAQFAEQLVARQKPARIDFFD